MSDGSAAPPRMDGPLAATLAGVLMRAATLAAILAMALAVAGCTSRAGPSSPADSRPNLVVLIADDLGWSEIGIHDPQVRTPNLDRFAREGLRFERFYVHPVCTPTRAAFFTGRHPARYGLGYSQLLAWTRRGLPPEETTLAERLRDAGYETALVGKWHLGHARRSLWPDRQGFEHFYGSLLGSLNYYRHTFAGGLDWQRDGRSLEEEGYATDLQGQEAVRLIRGRDPSRPLFLCVSFNAPHLPAMAPVAYVDLFHAIPKEGRRYVAAMGYAMDLAIGKILATLDEEGLRESTLVLFFSDNGAPISIAKEDGYTARNAPLRGGKWTVFEGGIRVPATVFWPGRLEGGGSIEDAVSVLDLLPTLCDAGGVRTPPPRPLDGRDLLPALLGKEPMPRHPIFLYSRRERDHWYAWIEDGWKVVQQVSGEDGRTRSMLFHVREDPSESHDLAAQQPERLRGLVSRLERAREELPDRPDESDFAQPEGWHAPRRWAEAAGVD